MLSTLSEMTLNSTTFSLKPVYCMCVSECPYLPCRPLPAWRPALWATSAPGVLLDALPCEATEGTKSTAHQTKSPSKLLLVNIQVKKKNPFIFIFVVCWHFCARFLTAVTHLAFNPSWYQLLIGQLSHSRHGGPQVPTGRRQDVADGDAGRLVHRHGSCVVT